MQTSLLFGVAAKAADSEAEILKELFAFMGIVSNLIILAACVLTIIGIWKVLQKAGEEGWKAIVPFYGKYTLFKTFWKKKWFWISLIPKFLSCISAFFFVSVLIIMMIVGFGVLMGGALSVLGAAFVASPSESSSILESYGSFASDTASGTDNVFTAMCISLLVLILSIAFSSVLKIILKVKISKAFGKKAGFTIGLIFLAPIFYMILGCGKSEYRKSKDKTPDETGSAEEPEKTIPENSPAKTDKPEENVPEDKPAETEESEGTK